MEKTHSVEEVIQFFAEQKKAGKKIVTFIGYSGAGYEDPHVLRDAAKKILDSYTSDQAIINIGVTPDGIGALYGQAKLRKFATSGIVSSQALEYGAEVSQNVDHVFFIQDDTWGGYLEDGETLSPTSEAMVAVSDVLVGIGGGEVGRDELLEAQKRGKEVHFTPTDMNHESAMTKAQKKGQPNPTAEFLRGAAADSVKATD